MGWSYDKLAKIPLAFVACFAIILVCISIWTLADPILKYFHFVKFYNYVYHKPIFEGRMFIIVPAIGIALGVLLLGVMVVGLAMDLGNLWVRRLVSWGTGVLLILNIAGIAILCVDDDIKNRYKILTVLDKLIEEYHYSRKAMDFMDAIQWKLQCCGIYGRHDYPMPKSTVFGPPETCPDPPIPQKGCIDSLLTYTNRRWEIFIAIYIILTLLQAAVISSVCLLGHRGFSRASTEEEKY